MANMIARLGVVLGLDSAEFSKGLEAAGKKLEQFGQAAEKFGKIGATALVAASAAAVKYADDLADVAEANEVAIGTVLQLSEALANSGGKADNAGKMLSAFAKFIDEAAGGSEKAQKTAAIGRFVKRFRQIVSRRIAKKYWTSDWESLYKFIKEHDAFHLMQQRIHDTNMKSFLEENPEQLPPGLNCLSAYTVGVRKAR